MNMQLLTGGFLKGKKTYITSGLGILGAIGAYLSGDMGLTDMIQTVFPLASMIFMRSGIENK